MRRALAVLVLAATLAALSPTPSAAAASWQPPAGAAFNDPTGDTAAQNVLIHRLDDLIRHTPRGATMYIASMTLSIDAVVDAMIAAHRRGANVRVILPIGKRDQVDATRLRAVLGSNYRARSWVRFCTGSCYRGGRGGVMHAKTATFSRSGSATDITVTSSGNLDASMTRDKYNDSYTTVGHAPLYHAMVAYMNRMRVDDPDHVPAPVSSGTIGMQFFPAGRNPFLAVLNNVHCSGPTRTRVRLTTSLWQGGRADVARRLVALHKAGCDVEVLVQSYRTSSSVTKILHDGHVPTRRADHDGHGNHSKYLAIYGHYGRGLHVRRVYSGSLNLTPIDHGCDNSIVRSVAYTPYAANFARTWGRSPAVTQATVAQDVTVPEGATLTDQ